MDIIQMDLITKLMWLYSILAAIIMLLLIGQILLMYRKIDFDIIRARLFLNEEILNETWKYISISGASFAVNATAGFLKFNFGIEFYHMWEISWIVFLAAFVAMIFQWHQFIGGLLIGKAPHIKKSESMKLI